jgi:hypothetical protein
MAAEVPDEEGTGDVFSWFGFRGGRRRLFIFSTLFCRGVQVFL